MIEDAYTLTPSQLGILFESSSRVGEGVYVEQLVMRLRGSLDQDSFRRSWLAAVDRHAVLRTAFFWREVDEPVQVVSSKVDLPWRAEDWRSLSATERDERLREYKEADRRQAFDLEIPPLLRILLVRLEDDLHLMVWTFHHILLDGWSVQLVLQDVFEGYAGRPKDASLSAVPSPYRHFVEWLGRQDRISARSFWRGYIGRYEPPAWFSLLENSRSPTAAPTRFRSSSSLLGKEQTELVREYAREAGLTLSTLLHAAWGLLLARLNGTSQVMFATALTIRPPDLPGVDRMVGLCLTTAPCRPRIDQSLGAGVWLAEVQRSLAQMQRYGYLGLTDIRKLTGVRVPDSLLVVENYPSELSDATTWRGLRIEETSGFGWTNFPLAILVVPGETISLQAKYRSDWFDEETVGFLLECLSATVVSLAAHGDLSLAELRVRPPRSRSRPVIEGGRTAIQDGSGSTMSGRSVGDRFFEMAGRYPDRYAVSAPGYAVTYEQVARDSRLVRDALLAREWNGSTQVALLFDHGPGMVPAIMGTLAAGLSFVPLDPASPELRLREVLHDIGAPLILTDAENYPKGLNLGGPASVWSTDALSPVDTPRTPPEVSADTIAYVMYTSGSTGENKGVVQSHGNLLKHIGNYTDSIGISSADNVSFVSAYYFDGGLMDVFGALLNGACLHFFDIRKRGLVDLARWIDDSRITVYHSTPSVFRYLLAVSDRAVHETVRCVVLGGEPVFRKDFDLFCKHFGARTILVNGFGPTECTLGLQHFMDRSSVVPRANVPLGYPVGGTEVVLIDEDENESDFLGEIVLRAEHIALGYWKEPPHSKSRFEAGPPRQFRTGDLGRRLPDGSIEHLGRVDSTFKVRGFRIGAVEIEQVVRSFPGVADAVAYPNDDQLVVSFRAQQDYRVSSSDLRDFIAERLPRYMTPDVLFEVDEFPLNGTGKIDRARLTAVGRAVRPPSRDRHAPRTREEEVLVRIWGQLLGTDEVSTADDFFELGGHSLLAMRLCAEVEKEFGKALPLSDLLRLRTIERMALALTEAVPTGRDTALVPINRHGSMPPLFVVHGVTGDLILYADLFANLGPDQPVYGIEGQGLDGQRFKLTTLSELASLHATGIRSLDLPGPHVLLAFCLGANLTIEIARRLKELGTDVGLVVLIDSVAPTARTYARKSSGSRIQTGLSSLVNDGFGSFLSRVRASSWRRLRARGERAKFAVGRGLSAVGASVPSRLRTAYNMEMNRRIIDWQTPGTYNGDLLVLRTETMDVFDRDDLGWSDFVRGRIDIIRIDTTHMFLSDSTEGVKMVAELLRARMLGIDWAGQEA